MKFNLGELEALFEKINDFINYLELIKLENKSFLLFLANGDKVKVKINSNYIPHLLGINTDILKNTGYYSGSNSFEILKNFINSGAYKFYNLYKSGYVKYSDVFSNFIEDKVDYLKENLKFNVNSTDFVCKYDSKKTYILNDKNQKYDYIIVKKLPDGVYGVMCLVKNAYIYVPMSNQIFHTKEDLELFLSENITNQEVTLFTAVSVKNDNIYEETKQPYKLLINRYPIKISDLRNLKRDFSCIIDVSQALEFHLNKFIESNNNRNLETEEVEKLCKDIEQGKLIDDDNISNSNVGSIINSYNKFICNKDGIEVDNNETYTSLKEELEDKKRIIEELNKRIEDLKESNKNAFNQIDEDNKSIEKYQDRQKRLLKILNEGD